MVAKQRKKKVPVVITQADANNARNIMEVAKTYPFEERDVRLNPDITSKQLFLLRYDWAAMKCLNKNYIAIAPGIRSCISSEGARSRQRKSLMNPRLKRRKPSQKGKTSTVVICPEDYWRRTVHELSRISRGLYAEDGPGLMFHLEKERELLEA